MGALDDICSEQFLEWERRGRGWQVWPDPVTPEPPFRPFYGYRLPTPDPDNHEGRRGGFLASLFDRAERKLNGRPATPPVEEAEPEPEPDLLLRDELVEWQVSLPPQAKIDSSAWESFLFSLRRAQEPLAFELIGTATGITTQLVASTADAGVTYHQMAAHFPEVTLIEQNGFLEKAWEQADTAESVIFDFGLEQAFFRLLPTAKQFPLDPFVALVAAMSQLRDSELVLFQVIFEPVREQWDESLMRAVSDAVGKDVFVNQPEWKKSAEQKVARPLFAAVVRLAIKSDDRLEKLAEDIAGALSVFHDPKSNSLIPLHNADYPWDDHEEDVRLRQSRRSGMILNCDELVSLAHLPSAAVRTPKLHRAVLKSKPAPASVTVGSGLLLGTNTHAGITREVRLSPDQRVRHTHLIGKTGTGKSTLLFQLIQQDIESGQGVAVIDPHGDLVEKILGAIPPHRIHDVVLLDVGDPEFAVGFNILSANSEREKNLLASDLVAVFRRLSTSWGDQMNSVLNNAILAFLESSRGGTLADLQRFLIEPAFRNDFLKTVSDAQVIYYWKRAFPQLTGNKSVGPVVTRLNEFLNQKPVRHMVTQKQNRLDFADIMDSGKIMLVKLPQGVIGNENAYLLGSSLVAKFQQLAMARQAQAAEQRRDFWLYLDEFHHFITPSMAQILSGARKYRLGLTLAHQELHDLQRDAEVSNAVLSNPCTRICFRVGDDDSKALEKGFGFFEGKDIQNLPDYQAIVRVEKRDDDFNLTLLRPAPIDEAHAAAIRAQVITASREKYAVSRRQLEAEQAAAMLALDEEAPAKPAPKPVTPPPVSSPPVAAPAVESFGSSAPPQAAEVLKAEIFVADETDTDENNSQHEALKKLIRTEAESLDYTVETEKELPGKELPGSKIRIDVVLCRGSRSIACEINVTTTVPDEVKNIRKCLQAGYDHVASIGRDKRKLANIEEAFLRTASDSDREKVAFYKPEDFLSKLFVWAADDPEGGAIERGKPRKRRISLRAGQLTEADRQQMEQEMLENIRKRMQGGDGRSPER